MQWTADLHTDAGHRRVAHSMISCYALTVLGIGVLADTLPLLGRRTPSRPTVLAMPNDPTLSDRAGVVDHIQVA